MHPRVCVQLESPCPTYVAMGMDAETSQSQEDPPNKCEDFSGRVYREQNRSVFYMCAPEPKVLRKSSIDGITC